MKIQNGLDVVSQRITNVANPASLQDAATKAYVDLRDPVTVFPASDLTGLTSTVVADTGLSFAVPSSAITYEFDIQVTFRFISGTSPTVRWGVSTPSISPNSLNWTITQQATATGAAFCGQFTTSAPAYTAPTGGVTAVTYGTALRGTFTSGASGTFALRYTLGGTTPNMTIYAKSYMRLTRLV